MIEVVFGPEPGRLQWEPYETSLARRWIDSLQRAIPKGLGEPDRVYNFPGSDWSRERIADEINACLDVIGTQHAVDLRATATMSQADFNELHRLFERIRGDREEGTDEWRFSTPAVQAALQQYNVLIHRWEDHVRNEARPKKLARFVASFLEKNYEPLEEADYEQFRIDRTYGELALNYCQVGKTIWSAQMDGDEHIDEGIRPLEWLSADFTAGFFPVGLKRAVELRAGIDAWLDRHRDRLERFGLVRENPRLGIGDLYVARLLNTPEQVEAAITGRTRIESVRLLT